MPASKNQRGIDAAKREVIAHHILGLQRAATTGDVVQLGAARVHLGQVQGRRKPVVAQHFNAHPRFQRAASTQGVAHITLE